MNTAKASNKAIRDALLVGFVFSLAAGLLILIGFYGLSHNDSTMAPVGWFFIGAGVITIVLTPIWLWSGRER